MKIRNYLFILVILCAGVFFSYSGLSGIPEKGETEKGDKWRHELKKYSEIYALVKQNYPEELDLEKIFYASISGLLGTLDPHSYFLDPLMVRSLNEDQQGNYYGIGTRITRYENRLTIVAPLPGTPAEKQGIMAGDVIARIEGEDTKKLSLDDAMKKLRGAKDTEVSIEIKREGIDQLLPFKIKRAEIPLNSITYSVTLAEHPDIGYISLRTFGGTTKSEVETSIKKLIDENHIKGLILDLRGNAGGSLYAAIDLADMFLEKGKVIVSVKGRTFNQSFKAKKDNQYENLPLTVLINRGSASASEIVASALQDHKRATILGSRSWGKGLVQTVSRLSLNSSLALTTAKYYTPSNKSLQRDFEERDDYYFFLSSKNYDSDTSIEGGVLPDISIEPDRYSKLMVKLISRGLLFRFARQLVNQRQSVTLDFEVDEDVFRKFRKFLKDQKFSFDDEEFKKDRESIAQDIRREVLTIKFTSAEGVKVFLKTDPVTQKAVQVLKKKQE